MPYLFPAGTIALIGGVALAAYQSARLLRRYRLRANPLLNPVDSLLRLALILAAAGLGLASGQPVSHLGWAADDPAGEAAAGAVCGVALAVGLGALSYLVVRRFGARVYTDVVVRAILPRDAREWPRVLLALAPAVLLEELLFRSLLIGGFAVYAPPLLLALAGCLLFGAVHAPQGLWGMAGTALAGLVLGLLFLTRGGLVAPLVAHYVFNALQLAAAGLGMEKGPEP